MGAAEDMLLRTARAGRVEKRGAKVVTGISGARQARGSDMACSSDMAGRRRRRRHETDRKGASAYLCERSGCRRGGDDADQHVGDGRQVSPADRAGGADRADRLIRQFHCLRGRLPGARSATGRAQAAFDFDRPGLRLQRMSVPPGAPFDRSNPDRRAEVAVDPVTGIGLLAGKLQRRDRGSVGDTKLDVAIARRRRNRMPMLQAEVKSHFTTRRLRSTCTRLFVSAPCGTPFRRN